MSDLISRKAAIDALDRIGSLDTEADKKYARSVFEALPSAQPEIIRCKDCNKASKCYGDVVMRSRGGGYIYCPLEFCSEAERRCDE